MTTSKLARRTAPSAIERHVGSLIRGMVSTAVEQNRMKARRAALKLIRENGELSLRSMLDEVIEDKAREGALYGAITGLVATIPGYGQVLTLMGALPDALYMLYRHCEVILYLAHVYDPRMSERRLKLLVGLALVTALGGEAARTLLRRATTTGLTKVVQNLLPRLVLQFGNSVLRTIGIRISRRGIIRHIPLVGVVVNAVACYAELKLAGRAYRKILDGFDSPMSACCPWCSETLELDDGWGQYVCPSCRNPLKVVP
jgi:hypothetical protein